MSAGPSWVWRIHLTKPDYVGSRSFVVCANNIQDAVTIAIDETLIWNKEERQEWVVTTCERRESVIL